MPAGQCPQPMRPESCYFANAGTSTPFPAGGIRSSAKFREQVSAYVSAETP